MATLNDATQADLSGYSSVVASGNGGLSTSAPSLTGTNDIQPARNTLIRCPLPPIFSASPDSLRQFYMGGSIPQARIYTTGQVNQGSQGTQTSQSTQTVTYVYGGAASNVSSYAAYPVYPSTQVSTQTVQTFSNNVATQALVTTNFLSPGNSFSGSVNMSKGFQLLGVTVTAASRVQLYGTAAAQLGDRSRQIDTPPPAGTAQNILCDVVLDTSPLTFPFISRVGANGDNPQQPMMYVTVTNLGQAGGPITLAISYVPLQR